MPTIKHEGQEQVGTELVVLNNQGDRVEISVGTGGFVSLFLG